MDRSRTLLAHCFSMLFLFALVAVVPLIRAEAQTLTFGRNGLEVVQGIPVTDDWDDDQAERTRNALMAWQAAMRRGQFEKALQELTKLKGIETDTSRLPFPGMPTTAKYDVFRALAQTYLVSRRVREAQEALNVCLYVARTVFGTDHPSTFHTSLDFARLREIQAKVVVADAIYTASIRLLERTTSHNDDRLNDALGKYADFQRCWELDDEADALFHRMIENLLSHSGQDPSAAITTRETLAILAQEQGDDAAASQLMNKAQMLRKSVGIDPETQFVTTPSLRRIDCPPRATPSKPNRSTMNYGP